MSDTLQVLERVNAFYAASFTQLITYTGAVLALVGVVLPLFVALLQARQTKRDQQSLSKEIEVQVSEAKAQLAAQVNKEMLEFHEKVKGLIESTRQDIEEKFKFAESKSLGRAFHLQANSSLTRKHFELAVVDALAAGQEYAKCSDEYNMGAIFFIANEALSQMTTEDFDDEAKVQSSLDEITTALKPLNKNGGYTRQLEELRRNVATAKKRQKPKAEAKAA